MAEAEERMFNEEAALEEQRRLAEEAAEVEQRRIQRMELILEIADLERERDKSTNRLWRMSNQTLSRWSFGCLEDQFITTTELNSRLSLRISDWTDLLDTDQDGNPQYPPLGMPESCYSPEGEDFIRKTSLMEEALSATWEILIKFLLSLSPREQFFLSLEVKSDFLKNPEALKAPPPQKPHNKGPTILSEKKAVKSCFYCWIQVCCWI